VGAGRRALAPLTLTGKTVGTGRPAQEQSLALLLRHTRIVPLHEKSPPIVSPWSVQCGAHGSAQSASVSQGAKQARASSGLENRSQPGCFGGQVTSARASDIVASPESASESPEFVTVERQPPSTTGIDPTARTTTTSPRKSARMTVKILTRLGGCVRRPEGVPPTHRRRQTANSGRVRLHFRAE
jgi:hypothetical protein